MPPTAARFATGLALVLTVGGIDGRIALAAPDCAARPVEVRTLQEVLAGIKGYDTSATTNQSRFVAEFLLGLAAHPDARSESGRFEIRPERFMAAWFNATGSGREHTPETMARVLEYGQGFVVDVAPDLRVAAEGVSPQQSIAVRVSWPDGDASPSHYTFVDTLSDPRVVVRHERVITYLLLDFGDWVAFERIRGVSVRPTSGPRASLAGVLGMADIRSTRLAVAADGMQIVRTEAHKLFRFTHFSTIAPDGTAERGVPRRREDLEELAERLELDLEIHSPAKPPETCP